MQASAPTGGSREQAWHRHPGLFTLTRWEPRCPLPRRCPQSSGSGKGRLPPALLHPLIHTLGPGAGTRARLSLKTKTWVIEHHVPRGDKQALAPRPQM